MEKRESYKSSLSSVYCIRTKLHICWSKVPPYLSFRLFFERGCEKICQKLFDQDLLESRDQPASIYTRSSCVSHAIVVSIYANHNVCLSDHVTIMCKHVNATIVWIHGAIMSVKKVVWINVCKKSLFLKRGRLRRAFLEQQQQKSCTIFHEKSHKYIIQPSMIMLYTVL